MPISNTTWEIELRSSLRTAHDLFQGGFIKIDEVPAFERLLAKFDFKLPRYYARLIDREDVNCPIRLQAIPQLEELRETEGYLVDPLLDIIHRPVPRVTHRYKNRLLIHLTPLCSMYCRFCFRKSLLNELKGDLFFGGLSDSFSYVKEQSDVDELIFSGGDPWLMNDSAFRKLAEQINQLDRIKRVRFHTRVPVTFPMRVTQNLIQALSLFRASVVVVTHFNHPKEVTEEVSRACILLKNAGYFLFNQSVLLKRVNDRSETLRELSIRLFDVGIIPYYLHHPDRAFGTGHFGISLDDGKKIYENLRVNLSGYLVPRYVIDSVDKPFKTEVLELS